MAIVTLPLPPGAEARALLHHLLEHGDVGRDSGGRTIVQLAVDDWVLDKLMTFDAGSEDLEETDAEPEPDLELDGPPVSGLILIRPKRSRRAR